MSEVTTTFRAQFLGTEPAKLPALLRSRHPIAIFASDHRYAGTGDELRIPVTPADALALRLLAGERDELQVEMTLTWRLP